MSSGSKTVVLDVREELSRGGRPMDRILDAVKALRSGESLQLVTPFEPLPLVALLKRFGLKHRSKHIALDHWETLFSLQLPEEVAAQEPAVSESSSGGELHVVDARGLEPPQPMVKILLEVEKLHPGERLEACTDRRPLHLIDSLHERGFETQSVEQADGTWRTLICRG